GLRVRPHAAGLLDRRAALRLALGASPRGALDRSLKRGGMLTSWTVVLFPTGEARDHRHDQHPDHEGDPAPDECHPDGAGPAGWPAASAVVSEDHPGCDQTRDAANAGAARHRTSHHAKLVRAGLAKRLLAEAITFMVVGPTETSTCSTSAGMTASAP